MENTEIKAVIFDMDGCLVDSEPLSLEAVAAEMRASGLRETTADDVRNLYLGVSVNKICKDVGERLGAPSPTGFVERVENRLFDVYETELRRIDGVTELLDRLSARGIATAIATGSSLRRLKKTLHYAGLEGYFTGRGFSADQVAHGKPAPDLFLLAARELGVDPAQCAVLEDSPHGIKGAVAAGMRAVGFVGGSHLDGRRDDHAARLVDVGAVEVVTALDAALAALAPESAGK